MNCHGNHPKNDPAQKQGIPKWFYLCGLTALGILIAVAVFKISLSNVLYYGIFLLCPLMHIFMMKGHSKEDSPEK